MTVFSFSFVKLFIWVGTDNKILFTFFEKPMASNMTIQKDSVMPENSKIATLNQELVRGIMNTSEDLVMEERILVLETTKGRRMTAT